MRRLIVPLLAILLYAVTLGGTFIYDDVALIIADGRVKDPHRWGEFWTDSYNFGVDNLYRPLTSMTYAAQYWLHGERAWPYHLVNIALHAIASALVAWLATKLATNCGLADRARTLGLLAGVLFAAHPVHVEAVAGIVGRAEMLCAIGTLGAIGLALDRLSPRRVAAIALLFLLALLSKEQGLLTPALIGVALWFCRERSAVDSDPAQKNLRSILFLLLMLPLAVYVYLKENVLGLKFWWERRFLDPWIQPLSDSEGVDRLLAPLAIAGRYLELLVVPHTLRLDYGGQIVPGVFRADDPYFWTGVITLLLWLGLVAFAAVRRDRLLLVALVSFGLLYALIGNLLTIIGVNMAERLMYLPSAFFLIVAARFLVMLPPRRALILTGMITALFALRTLTYAVRWNDRLRLYEYSARVEPRSMKALLLAMQEHLDRGDLEAAEQYVRKAITLDPAYDDAYLRLSLVLMERGDLEGAERAIETARKLRPEIRAGGYLRKLDERRAATQPAR